MSDYEEIIKGYHLPAAPSRILNLRYIAGDADWYVRTENGWFYCRTQDVKPENFEWAPCAHGPPGETS